jgi:hypothetical protein
MAAKSVRRPSSFLACALPGVAAAAFCLISAGGAAVWAQEASGGYAVRGTIVDAASGQPVARALVSLGQDFATLTGGDGQFSFEDVPGGGYQVSVRKPGYEGFGMISATVSRPGISRQPRPPHPIRVGPDMPSLSFRILPLAVITGHVTLSTADPADGIQVMAYIRQTENGRLHWTMAGLAQTRSDGSFRIDELPAANYILYTQSSLDLDRAAGNAHGPVFGYPAVYYPGVTDPTAAGMITLRSGQKVQADIGLVRQQFFEVTAVVQLPDPSQYASFQILDSSGRQTQLPASYDRRTQTVTASVPSGSWSLAAHSFGRELLWGRTDFQVAGAPVSLAISLLPVPHIPVNIRRDFTVSADNSQPQSSGPGLNLFLVAADDLSMASYGGGLNSIEGSNGQSWEIRTTQPGRYWVQAQAFPPAYVNSISSGGVDLAANPLVVVPGSTPAPIDVTLRNDSGTITGDISSQSPTLAGGVSGGVQMPLAWVYAIPLFPTPSVLPTGFLRPDGQFTIPNVPPGSYRVVACDSPRQIDFRSPEGLAAWSGKGQTVTVDAGSTAHVELSAVSTEGDQ